MKAFGNAICESFEFRVVDNDAITRSLFAGNIKCIIELCNGNIKVKVWFKYHELHFLLLS